MKVLAISSIGGHWIQLLRLSPLFDEYDVTYISTLPSFKSTVAGSKYYAIPDANRKNVIDLIKCTVAVFWYTILIRPKVIVTTGAAPGLIGIAIGKLVGAKTIWIDSIANVEKLSLSGNIAIKIADRVYTQWEHLAAPNIIYSGNVL